MMRLLEISLLSFRFLKLGVGFRGPKPKTFFGTANVPLGVVFFPENVGLGDGICKCLRLSPVRPVRSHNKQCRVERVRDLDRVLDVFHRITSISRAAAYESIIL